MTKVWHTCLHLPPPPSPPPLAATAKKSGWYSGDPSDVFDGYNPGKA